MNFNKFLNSSYLKENPLCGISTYKDELNLATGACTRKIKKLVLDGTENWNKYAQDSSRWLYYLSITKASVKNAICTHCQYSSSIPDYSTVGVQVSSSLASLLLNLGEIIGDNTIENFKAYLAQQYAAGTPVCVWYVLATPTTETITVPSGLSGTEEGYLNQSGTPTPTNPIYPTANTVEKWFDINHYIMGTGTDTLTTPADIYVNDTTATVDLKGNMEQSGTPTPINPIQPQSCGERTGNLWDENYTNISTTLIYKSFYVGDGIFTASTDCPISYPSGSSSLFFIAGNVSTGASSENNLYNNRPRTVESINGYVTIAYRITGSVNPNNYNTMINTGSSPLPYENFGYKIPISSVNTTTVYLGEVQTTRKIKKLVLDGAENISINAKNNDLEIVQVVVPLSDSGTTTSANVRSTHFVTKESPSQTSTSEGVAMRVTGVAIMIGISFITAGISTSDSYAQAKTKVASYLAAQYAADTPVTVWYVLAEPTTGVVNEPLMRIGDYADVLNNVSIPVTAGGDTISVGTTVQPSEVTVNYKGWHPIADVHERDNGAWT